MEILVESPLHEPGDCFSILHEPESKAIAAHGRYADGLGNPIEHGGRRGQIRVARTKVDDIHSASDQLAFLFGNLGQRVFWQTEQTFCVMRHYRLPCTGLLTRLTPGISTSTTSPGARGPTPEGVPVAMRSPGSNVMMREM